MKTRTINKIITGKFIAWTKTIADEKVRVLVEQNSIITGGCIVSMLLNEEINDFDVYFKTPETALAVAEYYVKQLQANPPAAFKDQAGDIKAVLEPAVGEKLLRVPEKDEVVNPDYVAPRVRVVINTKNQRGLRGEQMQDYQNQVAEQKQYEDYQFAAGQVGDTSEPSYEGNVEALDNEPAAKVTQDNDQAKRGKYRVMFMTANAITLSDQIQIVLRFQGDVETIHTNYDFVHCTNAWTSWDKKLILRNEALEAILTKELKYVGSKYPICSIIRTRKFITRGWTINAGQYVKMCYQVSKLDMSDPKVLEDQLVGVDSAYFSMLIADLQKQADPTKVDGAYLMTLIDRIF